MKLKEKLAQYEKNESQFKKQIQKFNLALDTTDDTKIITVLAGQISNNEDKLKANYEDLTKAKIELAQLEEQYSESEAVNAYYSVKDRINQFFTANTEEQRNNLIAIIKNCVIFGTNLLIDTGKTLFVFDTDIKHKFDDTLSKRLLENLNNDEIYKEHFIGSLTPNADTDSAYIENTNRAETIKERVFNPSGISLYECDLSIEADTKSVEKLFKMLGITYDFSGHKSVVFDLADKL
jgi:hypothetical protein